MSPLVLENEKKLVELAQKDPEAFHALFEYYFPKVYSYVSYKVGDERAVIEDLVSEIMEKSFVKIRQFTWGKYPFRAWLFRIARNHIVDYFRTKKSYVDLDAIKNSYADTSSDVQKIVEDKEKKKILSAMIHKLKPNEQEIVLLKFSSGYSNREIATMLHLTETNVGSILYRAVNKLKEDAKAIGIYRGV